MSTDAAVADPKEVEIELGYFNLERTRRQNTIATPSMVLNYGFAKRLELVGEFRLEVSPEVELTDPGLSLKGVVKEGVLQDKPGPQWRPACCFPRHFLANMASDSRRSVS